MLYSVLYLHILSLNKHLFILYLLDCPLSIIHYLLLFFIIIQTHTCKYSKMHTLHLLIDDKNNIILKSVNVINFLSNDI